VYRTEQRLQLQSFSFGRFHLKVHLSVHR